MLERGWAAVLLLVVAMASGEHEYGWPGEDPEAVGVDLSMLEDGAGRPLTVDGSPAVAGSPAPWWFDGGLTAAPEFTVRGGLFEDLQYVSMVVGTLDAVIIYTSANLEDAEDMDEPELSHRGITGKIFDGRPLRVTRNTVIRAIAVHTDALDSAVAETRIFIQNRPPVFSVYQGTFDDTLEVVVRANSSEPSAMPYIAVTLDGTDPHVSGKLGVGEVTVKVRRTAVLRAMAFQDGLVRSNISHTGVLEVTAAVVEEQQGWRGTLAWWSLGDSKYHYGQYSRGRERWGGACEEQHATEIYPARIAERDGMLGAAVLTGPACKGGAWDVDPEGISTCDVHALKFNGSLGTSGYSGRFERGTPASQSCLIRRQPNLETFAVVHRGVKALRFDGAINRGLLVSNAIDALLDQDRLPKGAFSLELQMTVGSAATAGREVRALAAAQQDSAGLVGDGSLYSKGWSLVYETDSVKGSLTLRFAVALEANNDANDHGRLRFLTHSLPTLAVEDEQWTHLVAVYDQRMLRLYVNGSLAAEAPACEEGDADATGCGAIVYPLATDPLARQATPFTLGSYENRQTGLSASHVGLLAEVRLFRGALPPHIISAAARRLMMGNPDGYCEEGESGTYQGLKPCDPCAPGSYSDEPRRDSCELCPRGLWQDGSGRTLCLSCPVHMTTKAPGAAAEAECLEPDECATWSGLLNPCHPNATCTKIQSNLSVVAPGQNPPVCTCNPGYHGDGYNCSASCGDGIVVPGEPCDDGNTLDSDGCSSTCTVEPDFVCPSNPDAPHLQSACECTADGEICCARAYVKCLLEASRFTAVGHGHASPGLDSNGCMTERLADPTWHLAHAGEHCADACARVPSAGSPEGGDHECVAHSTEMSSLQYLQSVSLPAAAGQDIAALHTTVGVGSGAKMGQDVLTRQARHRSSRAGLFCSRVVNTSSNTGLAARLVPESLPMVDEFSASGERGLIGNAIGGDDGAPDVELICYVHDDGVPTVEAMDEWCFARATVPTGRRMCRCRHKPNRCSRDCLAEQARCNARVASRDHRLASAAEVHSPCYDDPNYRGRFFDNITAVNISLNNCSAVADFLWRASLNVTQLRASPSLNLSAEELNRTRSWNDSDADGTGSTLQQRFALSASCGCGACPVACGTCDKCYQEGGTYFYGGSHVAHPTRLKHPSSLHGVAAPAMLAQCAAGDDECFEAGCKKALAYCASHGLSKCLDDVVCWKSEYDSNSCPDAYAPWVGRPSEYRPPVEQVREDEVSCECMAWFHNCLLRARWGGM